MIIFSLDSLCLHCNHIWRTIGQSYCVFFVWKSPNPDRAGKNCLPVSNLLQPCLIMTAWQYPWGSPHTSEKHIYSVKCCRMCHCFINKQNYVSWYKAAHAIVLEPSTLTWPPRQSNLRRIYCSSMVLSCLFFFLSTARVSLIFYHYSVLLCRLKLYWDDKG